MTVHSSTQLTIDFNPGLSERHSSLLDCVRQCVYSQASPLKTIAADMDISPSELSRKLADNPNDPRRLSVDDLEMYIQKTGDTKPIYYLVEKYLQNEDIKRQRATSTIAKMLPDLIALMKQASA